MAGRSQRLSRTEGERTRRYRLLAVIAVLAVVFIGGWLLTTHGGSSGHRVRTGVRTPSSATARAATSVISPPRPGRDVSWRAFFGLSLPVSATAGPHCLSQTRAACFSDSPDGAAIAAAQLLVRTFAFTGPACFGPTITGQVTGTYQPMLARVTGQAYWQAAAAAGVRHGRPIGSSTGAISGYQPVHITAAQATINVLVAQSTADDGDSQDTGGGFTNFTVTLVWLNGDWRLVAPALGDWTQAAHTTDTPDPGEYLSYDQLGAGGAAS